MRTRLTTPPGQEPVDTRDQRDDEDHAPAFALPEEPRVPSRYLKPVVSVVTVVALLALAWWVFTIATSTQAFDPSLQQGPLDPATAPAP